jgi:hypothetical protein
MSTLLALSLILSQLREKSKEGSQLEMFQPSRFASKSSFQSPECTSSISPVSGARKTADMPAAAPLINMMRRSRTSSPKRRSLVDSHDPIAPPL